MKLRLLVVGKGDPTLAAFEAEFIKRLKAFGGLDVVELPEGKSRQPSQCKQQEEKTILKSARPGFVLFDERGKSVSSMQWADFFRAQHGGAEIDFVIGGASGVSDEVRRQAGQCWSLSALVMPHKLVRALVIEQIYRAHSILQGHPYHRA